jgi:hypothetical protein
MESQLSVESGQAAEGSGENGQWSLPQKPVNNPRWVKEYMNLCTGNWNRGYWQELIRHVFTMYESTASSSVK